MRNVISAHHVSGEAPFLEYQCSRDRVLFERSRHGSSCHALVLRAEQCFHILFAYVECSILV